MYLFLVIIVLAGSVTVPVSSKISVTQREADYFTNTWSVQSSGGGKKAKRIAEELGFDFVEQVSIIEVADIDGWIIVSIVVFDFAYLGVRRTSKYLPVSRPQLPGEDQPYR